MTDPKLIIALDPGGTTGLDWCYRPYVPPGRPWEWGDSKQISPCNVTIGLRELLTTLSNLVHLAEPLRGVHDVHIVMENFEFRPFERRDRIDYTPAEVIGAVRAWCLQYSRSVLLVRPSASLGKGFWTDDKIKKLGLWVPGRKHAMDARRHNLRYRSFDLHHSELFLPLRPGDLIPLPSSGD